MNMCMVRDGERVVVIDRRKPDWPGITFPGGHVEPGESITASVIREIKEETGLTIASPRLCGITHWCEKDCRYIVFLYSTEDFSGELCSSDEGEVRWELLEELPNLPLTSGMEHYLRVYSEPALSELFYRPAGKCWIPELL